MAIRLASARMPVFCASSPTMKGIAGNFTRYYGDGRILSEEERAKENVYIQKMEREKIEKQKRKAEKERAEKEMAQKEKIYWGGEIEGMERLNNDLLQKYLKVSLTEDERALKRWIFDTIAKKSKQKQEAKVTG